ncbi:hypothetical protein, partial [Salmonella sp. SAL4431]|uniref:hypothetical protein n=1 Tax=Salmonella sp. SAL4431 TaxID=3159886 RepID=UPI00397E3A11
TNIAYNGSNQTTFSAWQSATSFDASSVNVDPKYNSATDLHTLEAALNGKAQFSPDVPRDIDNEVRSTTAPDIGADEFTPSSI